jgi:hypothetical protein
MKNKKLTLEFGVPEHGWLPVKMAFNDFSLEFEASDVPANSIDQLILSLRSVIKGIKSEVWWPLEPAYYYFEFERFADAYNINVFFANSDNSDKKKVFELNGNFDLLILPFYRAIKTFTDQSNDELNWPKTDKIELENLVASIKEIKAAQNKT